MNLSQAVASLDKVIKKSRVHLYKPLQIAEILYRDRVEGDINLSQLETYRNVSKNWRDQVSQQLLRRVCTSSQKFQDNLFEANAIHPEAIVALAIENKRTGGLMEKRIYDSFFDRQSMVAGQLELLNNADRTTFNVQEFIDGFTSSAGLRRSVDKAYEIVVYALFDSIVCGIGASVTVKANPSKMEILKDFEDFTRIVLGIDSQHPEREVRAKLYRVGVTNAADRGLDMWANFGTAVQVKHLTFSEELADDITSCLSADEIVIVCEKAEAKSIQNILKQLGIGERVKGVITEDDLIRWYEKCLRGKFSEQLGSALLKNLVREFHNEFPSATGEFEKFYKSRGYNKMNS